MCLKAVDFGLLAIQSSYIHFPHIISRLVCQMSSYSSRDVLSHPYQYQRQRQGQNHGPSFDNSSSPSHPTAAPAPTPASPAVQPSLVHHPGLSGFSHNLVDPAPSPAVRRLPGTGFDDLTQQGLARSGVRSVRSYSSPPLASGLNTGLAGSSLYPGSNLGIQSASSSFATNQRYVTVFGDLLDNCES